MFRALLAFLLFFGALTAVRAQPVPDNEFTKDCRAQLAVTSVRIKIASPEPNYDYSKNMAELSAMSKRPGTMGLTVGNRRLQLSTSNKILSRASGGIACTRPVVEMTLTVMQKVYVGREFVPGTCTFREIKEHEQRHVRANREYAQRLSKQVEQDMLKAFGNEIYYAESAASLRKHLNDSITEGWFKQLDEAFKGVEAWHEVIDSPQEYERPNLACKGEPHRLTKKAGIRSQ